MKNINEYIPFSTEMSLYEQACLNELKADRLRNEELDRIGNSFERISEMLTNLHAGLNTPQNEEASYVN